MREFFKQCLEELEDVSGIRQLYWLRQSCETKEDFDKRKSVLIESMVLASQRFPYINQEEQKKIIRRMMIEDQQYDALNSRTIHKWLDLHKDKFPFITESEMEQSHAPEAPPEVAAKYIEKLKAIIESTGRQVPTMTQEEIQKEGHERIKDPMIAKLKDELSAPFTPRQKFVIEGIEIIAVSQEEAQKAFDATFK